MPSDAYEVWNTLPAMNKNKRHKENVSEKWAKNGIKEEKNITYREAAPKIKNHVNKRQAWGKQPSAKHYREQTSER